MPQTRHTFETNFLTVLTKRWMQLQNDNHLVVVGMFEDHAIQPTSQDYLSTTVLQQEPQCTAALEIHRRLSTLFPRIEVITNFHFERKGKVPETIGQPVFYFLSLLLSFQKGNDRQENFHPTSLGLVAGSQLYFDYFFRI